MLNVVTGSQVELNTEVLFDVTEDALLVANGGCPFSREGVISICASHLGEKTADRPVFDDFEPSDDLVEAIRKRGLGTYRGDINRILSDFGDEEETRQDYGGRFLWELLQNADDAMGGADRTSADLIGSKGLGFKSVLEITEEPEVHSGPFHFRFSVSKTQELLRGILREKGRRTEPPPLIFRIPHDCKPDQAVQRLLDDGFATVVRLPFRNGDKEKVRETVADMLRGLDPSFLLLSHEIRRVRIRNGKTPRVIGVKREPSGLSDSCIELIDIDSDGVHRTSSRRWLSDQEASRSDGKRLTVAVCLPLDHSGEANAHQKSPPLYVFFPTEERHGARALIHASFDLQASRKRLRKGQHDDAIFEELKQLLERVLLEIPARTALEVFGHVDSNGNDSSLMERLRSAIRSTVESTPFVPILGGERVKPGDVRLWNYRLGDVLREDVPEVREARLLVPDLTDLRSALEKFDANKFSEDEHIRLLRHCRNESIEACFASFRALFRGALKQVGPTWYAEKRERDLRNLRAVPCWWTEDGKPRALDDEPRLLFRRPSDWPDWLPADTLHPRMRNAVEWCVKRERNRKKSRTNESSDTTAEWLELIRGWCPRKPEEYLEWVLIPFVTGWDTARWKSEGWKVLKQYAAWSSEHKFKDVKPLAICGDSGEADKRRTELATKLFLPTDKGWLPAGDCYASKAWDGPPEFDDYFGNVKGRGCVLPFRQWPGRVRKRTNKELWKGLLRYAGVSWEPKIRQIKGHSEAAIWEQYRDDANVGDYKYCEKDWEIEFFPECVNVISKLDALSTMMSALNKSLEQKKAIYHKRRHGPNKYGRNYYPDHYKSFADYQLRRDSWLPHKQCLLYRELRVAPNDAYLPGKDLRGLLPAVVKPSGVGDEEWWRLIIPLLKLLGVKDELPAETDQWHKWMRLLPKVAQDLGEREWRAPTTDGTDGGGLIWESARALYGGYLTLPANDVRLPKNLRIPCTAWIDGCEQVGFAAADEVLWVDQAHLDVPEVRRSLLKRKYKLFVLRLNAGKKAPERLRIRPLSEVVRAKAHYVKLEGRESQPLAKRYKERRIWLTKAAVLDKPLPESLAIEGVRNLQLSLETGKDAIAEVEVLAWSETNNSLLVNLDKNRWRALANGLACRIINKKDKQPLFETLLGVIEKQELIDRLREQGLTEPDIQEGETELIPPTPPGSDGEGEGPSVDETVGGGDGGGLEEEKEEKGEDADIGSDQIGLISQGDGAKKRRRKEKHVSPRPETGVKAEDWLFEKLQEVFPASVARWVPDEKGSVSDFVLSVRSEQVHIEAKNVENLPGIIFWSGLQCEKARELERNGEPYFLAILHPNKDQSYEIYWFWDPLNELKGASRDVQWAGESDYQPVDADTWEVTDRRPLQVPTKHYKFRLRLTPELLRGAEKDSGLLGALKRKLDIFE